MNILGSKFHQRTLAAIAAPTPIPRNPLQERAPLQENPPQRQDRFLNPRWEPSNITQNATAQSVMTAIREAENGETRELFRFYRDSLLSDNHIQGLYTTRKLAMLAQPIAILPGDKKNADDVAAVAAVGQMISDCANWTDGCSALLSSFLWPVTCVEKIFKPADPIAPGSDCPSLIYTLARFEPVNPMLFCFRWAYLTGGVAMGTASPLQQAGLAQEMGIPLNQSPYIIDLEKWEPYFKLWPSNGRIIYDCTTASYLDPARHITHRNHLLAGEFRDNWGGPMRAILGWWLLRQLGRDWFGRFMQRYGNPFPVMKVDVEDAQAIEFAREAMKLATTIGGLVIDHDDSVELVAAAVQGGAEGHKLWNEVCNNEISRFILGQDSSSSSKGSGLDGGAQARMAQGVREDYRQFDQMRLGETLQKQLFRPFLDLNGLPGNCKAIWGGLSEDDAEKLGGLLVQLNQANLEPADDSMATISERIGFAVQKKAPQPMPGSEPGNEQEETEQTELKASLNLKDVATGSHAAPTHPSDLVAAEHAPALSQLLRGAHAPIREILLTSSSREEAITRCAKFYSDWHPQRVTDLIDGALQQCAAKALTAKQEIASPALGHGH